MTLIEEYAEISRQADFHKHDHKQPAQDLVFDEGSRLIVPTTLMGDVGPLSLHDRAYRQLFGKLGTTVFGRGSARALPYDYLMGIPADQRAYNLNRHLAGAGERQWLVRGYGPTARAILDHTYAPISNTEVLEALDLMLAEDPVPGLQLVRPYVDADRLHLKSVWRNDDGGHYGLGVYVGNNEVGEGMLRVMPLVQKHSCTNSIIMQSDNALEFIHRGLAKAKMIALKTKLIDVLKLSVEVYERLLEAEARELPSFEAVLGGIARDQGWSPQMLATVAVGSGGRRTLGGLIDGVTYAAHAYPDLSPDDQNDLELMGGALLAAPETLFERAANKYLAGLRAEDPASLEFRQVLGR